MPEPDLLALVLFALTYLGLAFGGIPGLKLDRTGVALLGAVAFLATGRIDLLQAKEALDVPTLAVLFGMMVLSAQYHLAGLYRVIGARLAAVARPQRLLLGTILAAAALAAVLTNDVVCFVLTPVLGAALLAAGRDPLPYLLAVAAATNIGSAATPIGNPQNILIAQALELPFAPFLAACALPVLASLAFLYLWIRWAFAGAFGGAPAAAPATAAPAGTATPLDRWQAGKALLLTAAAIVMFLVPGIPAYLTALGCAGVVLLSARFHTRELLALVDWNLLALFCSLFVVVRGLELAGWTAAASGWLEQHGYGLGRPLILTAAAAALSNLVSNVPAVMLLLPFLERTPATGHGLALVSTFAGNALLVGSIANLIVAEQAARLGLRLGFRQHLRVGLPVTLFSLAAGAAAMAWW